MDQGDEFLRRTATSIDLVYNLARRILPPSMETEDLVQETFLRAFRAWTDGQRPRRVEPWLATICLNVARSEYRRRKLRPDETPIEELEAQSAEDDPEAEAMRNLDRSALERCLRLLPEEQRIALALVDLAGFSTAEAARIVGSPKGTILSRIHRARRALARSLRPQVVERER